jgi:hypothetical protein
MTVIEPSASISYEFLAMALAAESAPGDAVEEALRKRASLATDSILRETMTQQTALAIALLAGDLTTAEATARRGVALVEDAQTEAEHDGPLEVLLDILEERGDSVRALTEAEAFQRKAAAWTQDAPWGVRLRLAFMRYEAGRLGGASPSTARDALFRKWAPRAAGSAPFWPGAEGVFVTTKEEAADVLSTLRAGGSLQQSSWAAAFRLGRTLLLARHPVDAVAPLETAAHSCAVLSTRRWVSDTIWWMRAHVLLGQALEQSGDTVGACAAYAVVRDRWKNAKPRSVTLDKARERSRALACPKP